MTEEESYELAAQVWCGENTKDKIMDPALALEFATILRREVNKALGQKKRQWAWED